MNLSDIDQIVIDFEVVNISNMEQTVFEVRTINNLPSGWSSSLCFGDLCFSPDVIASQQHQILIPRLDPGDTLKTSIHVYTDYVNVDTAYVQIQVGTFRNPDIRICLILRQLQIQPLA